MTPGSLGDIAHPTEVFSDRDHLGKALPELNAGWPILVMMEGHPHLLLPCDAVGHRDSRLLVDLPFLPALVLPAQTLHQSAFESIGEDDFVVVRSGEKYSVIGRVSILEALIKELEFAGTADALPETPLPDIVDELPEGIVTLDEAHCITFCNRSGRRFLNLLSPAKKGECIEALADVPLSVLMEEAKQGLPTDLRLGKPVIRIFSVRILRPLSDQTSRMVLILRDVTHIRHRQLRDATRERMALLGSLASGIAHDFNNMLTVIMTQASLIQMKSDHNAAGPDGTETILNAAVKSSHLVHQLMVFGRREMIHSSAMNIQDILKELESILQKLLGERVALELLLPEDLWPVAVDPAQIERIVANLVVNSRNAMPGGGHVIIEASNEENCTRIPSRNCHQPVRAIRICVRDTGRGMSADTLARVFEPFFTTHDEDGTGLGLATVQCEVNQLGGSVTIQSEPAVGTTVEIFLPVSEKPIKTRQPIPVHHSSPPMGGDILVIESQEDLRKSMQRILEHAGYAVQTARSFSEAQENLSAGGEPDLLILDPSRKDTEMVQLSEIQERFPHLRILLLNQETEVIHSEQSAWSLVECLAKPFSGVELLDHVTLLVGEGVE